MLVARTPTESRLYMDLHACVCGEDRFTPEHWLEERDGVLVAVYEGTCRRCGRLRRFEFALDDDEVPPAPAFGSARPSRIIDPGQFHSVSDAAARRVPADLDDIPRDRWAAARNDMLYAIAALEEVAKFIPPGADAVPEEAFTSELGRAMYQSDPRRFSRERIEARLRSYREGLRTFD